jgi:membrane protein YqaA with SNARE-associated domain
LVIFAAAFYAAHLVRESETLSMLVRNYGYAGAFFVSVLSGFNLAVPIPAISFLPLFQEAGLNLGGILITITVGMTIADCIAYALGRLGRKASEEVSRGKILTRIQRLYGKHPWAPPVVLFLFSSFAPLPNEIIVIPLGFLRFRFIYLLPILLAGNMVFNLLAGYGVLHLFSFV